MADDKTFESLGKAVKSRANGAYDSKSDEEVGRAFKKAHPQGYEAYHATPTAWENFWSNFKQTVDPRPALQLLGKGMQLRDPKFAASPEGQKVPGELYQGFVEPQVQMFREAGEAERKGEHLKAMTRAAEGLLPGVGPAIAKGGKQLWSGDTSGGYGTWAGVLAPFGAAKLAGSVAGKISKGAASPVYGGGLKFDKEVSLDTRPEVVSRGLGREVPKAAGEKPSSGTPSSRKGLEFIQKRINQTKPRVMSTINASQLSGIPTISPDFITKPVLDIANRYENAGAVTAAESLRKLVKNFKDKHKGLLVPQEVQEIKEDIDTLLSNKDFGDTELSGQKLGHEKMRDQARVALEHAVPPVEQINWAIHLDSELKTAITNALKSSPNWIAKFSPFALGAAGETALHLGHGVVGGTMLVGALIRAAMNSPRVMSELGIALDEAGVALPKSLPKMAGAYSAITLGPNVGKERMPDVPPGGKAEAKSGPPPDQNAIIKQMEEMWQKSQ